MTSRYKPPDNGEDEQYVYRPYITLKNGRRIFAAAYGLKAFKIPVRH